MAGKHSTRAGQARRLIALGPLSIVSAAWTFSVAGAGALPVPRAHSETMVEAAVSVPSTRIEEPASLSPGAPLAPLRRAATTPIARRGDAPIPTPALAAYQRAAMIMRNADEACHLEWTLLAAIGAVESAHGTASGGGLGDDGVAVPDIIGIPLDGRHGVANISDTDGGRYDGDKSFDRAVGPMQFVPTTWGVVGVDADNDGQRDPQDVDDAALAAAVYLCSGDSDLSTQAGRHSAVLRYNHSSAYADAVLAIAQSYAAKSFAPVAAGLVGAPDGVIAATASQPAPKAGRRADSESQADQRRPPSHTPEPQRSGPPPQGGPEVPPSAPSPAPEPRPGLLGPVNETLECAATSLDKLLQPSVLTTCLAPLGR